MFAKLTCIDGKKEHEIIVNTKQITYIKLGKMNYTIHFSDGAKVVIPGGLEMWKKIMEWTAEDDGCPIDLDGDGEF